MLYLVVFTHVDGAVFATRSHLSFYDAMSFGTLMACCGAAAVSVSLSALLCVIPNRS